MTSGRGHPPEALAALAAGGLAAALSGAAGPVAVVVLLAVLAVGWGRRRGWSLARALDRPRVATSLAAVYLPIFLVDFASGARVDPVLPLVRLVIFLAAVEVLTGDPARAHRPILLGLLLVVASAAETTEIAFALPLGLYAWASARALMRHGLVKEAPDGGADASLRVRGALPLAGAALLLGLVLFGLIPRVGAGWGARTWGGRQTGLTESVDLGDVARIKRSTAVAFLARLEPEPVDPETIYWRGRVLVHWTGSGWVPGGTDSLRPIPLPADTPVRLPSLEVEPPGRPNLAEVEVLHRPHTTLLVPGGRPISLRAPRAGRVYLDADGALVGRPGDAPRQYTIMAHPTRRVDAEPLPPAAAWPEQPGAYLDPGRQPREVASWAASLAAGEEDPRRVARAFLDDLQSRPYSLDPRGIDPARPLASFLEGNPAHCEFFASALVIGLRLRGIPARAVSGYLGADGPTGAGDYLVREARAHLWAEAALPGLGWVTLDPTPAEGRRPVTGGAPGVRLLWERIVLAWDTWIIGFDFRDQITLALLLMERLESAGDGARALLTALRPLDPVAAAVLLVGVMAAAVWVIRRRRRVVGVGLPAFYGRLLAVARSAGPPPGLSETAQEFAARVGAPLGDPAGVVWIARLYERERFGGRPASPGELARADAVLSGLRRHVASGPRSREARTPREVAGR